MTGLAPIGDGFFNEPSLGVMLREKFWLVNTRRKARFAAKSEGSSRVLSCSPYALVPPLTTGLPPANPHLLILRGRRQFSD
jgi:hypothetical protein